MSKWESSRGYPEIEKIIYICNRYGVTMDTLFSEEVPLGRRDTPAAAPEELESRTLKTALEDFCSNLSPWNKWVGAGSLAAAVLLILVCIQCVKGGADNVLTMIWVGAIIVFGIVEAVTAGLVSIWFVIGAVAAMLVSVGGFGIWVQMGAFIAVSAAALALTRPLVRKLTADRTVPTNADRVIGGTGKVTETIDNDDSSGAVYVDGKTWTARSADGSVIPAGEPVRIVKMEGVKLFVEKIKVMEGTT